MSPIEGNVGHPFKLFGSKKEEGREGGEGKRVLFGVYSC